MSQSVVVDGRLRDHTLSLYRPVLAKDILESMMHVEKELSIRHTTLSACLCYDSLGQDLEAKCIRVQSGINSFVCSEFTDFQPASKTF